MTRHVVWDWNGTLLDDFPAVLEATNALAGRWGWRPIDKEYYSREFSRPIRSFYEKLLGRAVDDHEFARLNAEWLVEYHERRSHHDLAADARAALDVVEARGATQSLCSMYDHLSLVEVVDEHCLRERFVAVHGNDGSHHFKREHLVAHLRAVSARVTAPIDPVLIGDTVDDAEAARAAGIACVLVTTGEMTRGRLEPTGVPVADSLLDALAIAL